MEQVYIDLKDLAKNNIATDLSEFYMLSMCHDEIRNTTSDRQANGIFILVDLLKQLQNIQDHE